MILNFAGNQVSAADQLKVAQAAQAKAGSGGGGQPAFLMSAATQQPLMLSKDATVTVEEATANNERNFRNMTGASKSLVKGQNHASLIQHQKSSHHSPDADPTGSSKHAPQMTMHQQQILHQQLMAQK